MCSKHALTSVLWGKNKSKTLRKSGKSSTCSVLKEKQQPPQETCLYPGPHAACLPDQLGRKEKEAHLLPMSEHQGTETAWVGVGVHIPKRKQTLDMPLLLDSGKNLIGWCSDNLLKLCLYSVRGNTLISVLIGSRLELTCLQ